MYKRLPAEEELYQSMVNIWFKLGAKMVHAKVNALLFLEPGPISLETIATQTGYSLASVSNAVKYLELVRAVRRSKEPGSKKIYVQGEKNFVQMIHQQFKQSIDTALKPMQEVMPGIIEELKKELKKEHGKEKKQAIKEKIAWYQEYLEQNRKITTLFTHIEQQFKKLEHEHR